MDQMDHPPQAKPEAPITERIARQERRVHINTGAVCNNNCIFCMEEDRDARYVENSAITADDVRRILDENRGSASPPAPSRRPPPPPHPPALTPRRNLPHLGDIYRFLRAHGVDQVVFNVMQANGRADTYFEQIFPRYVEIADTFRRFLAGAE